MGSGLYASVPPATPEQAIAFWIVLAILGGIGVLLAVGNDGFER